MAQIATPHPAVATATATTAPKLTSKSEKKLTPFESLIAGGFAGATEACITYPFEYAKTRSQLKSTPGLVTSSNPFSLLTNTIKTEGVASLYTGCGALALGTALKAGVRFLTFDTIKAHLTDPATGTLSKTNGVLAGMAAGAVESIVAVTPTERIKTALIDDAKGAKRFRSTFHGVTILLREQGFRGIYRGLVSTTAKQSATSAVRMGAYNAMRSQFAKGNQKVGVVETFAMGAAAGTITVYATQPLDTIKTRSQSARGEKLIPAIVGVWREGGLKGYWKGSTMRLGRLVLSGGIVFAVYEQIANVMRLA
ncbi:hypothetical protein CERZMDRAFT_97468 [Cercospora zeae-maydis SCOH1-5]|uniref:Mitochondrial thiamine pyrophosphate carrier 1 n=1 Tax=Cercospora zeae-maydis SCOH1-5 TaxID=717836 RepID=A0A6A6FFK9_9PEZI|nr:hypothetical protein CERZMDRAFT_97468 [Cercospora zeae-maydis SCOH1-5]